MRYNVFAPVVVYSLWKWWVCMSSKDAFCISGSDRKMKKKKELGKYCVCHHGQWGPLSISLQTSVRYLMKIFNWVALSFQEVQVCALGNIKQFGFPQPHASWPAWKDWRKSYSITEHHFIHAGVNVEYWSNRREWLHLMCLRICLQLCWRIRGVHSTAYTTAASA